VAKIGYVASYAWQKSRGDNPLKFSNDYYYGELNFSVEGVKLAGGEEIMQGNGTVGFATPLATSHLFEGWADKFLTTPANGIKDPYGSIGWTGSHFLGLDSLAATAIYRSFEAQRVDVSYGSEWDFVLTGKRRHYAALLQYVSYMAATATPAAIARNTSKFWAQLEYIW
jgi:hypothetical protein